MRTTEPLPSSVRSLTLSLRLGWRAQPALMAAGFAVTVLGAAPDALLALALSRLVAAAPSGDPRRIAVAAGALAALVTTSWLFGIGAGRINTRLTDRAAVDIESYMVRLHATVPTIEHHERADHVDRLSLLRDHAPALSELYQMLFSGLGVVVRLLITVGLLASIRPELVLLVLFAIPPVLVSDWRGKAEKRAEEAGTQAERRARSLFLLGTTLPAAKEVRVARLQQRLVDLATESWSVRYRPMARARSRSAIWLSGAYAVLGVALIGSVALVATGPDAAPAAVLTLAAGSRLSQYLGQTVRDVHLFRVIWLDGARRLTWLDDFARSATATAHGAPPDVLRAGIRVENLTFRYPGADRDVLENVTLDLPAGAVVAVVGENGAGKSTFVKLLCRHYEPAAGRITVDGTDLATISPAAWQERVSGAFQDFVKFEYPVREAVGVGDLARIDGPGAVPAALDRAGATDLVAGLPQGLDTQLGAAWEGGVDLSHGQWQKIALARGFMRDRPLLLVLDEPSSALDAQAEWELFERYASAARRSDTGGTGQITVLVSHRFSTVQMADLIVVLDGSHVVEHGSHQELIQHDGLYAELYGIQANAYRGTPGRAHRADGPSVEGP
ncbi:ABC transporter ATP-binding protein [Micromonospora sp. NPDC092111]|uniref:ABC transporter ATP-binding protein n=1 Tax=Micromonospora sp. NPDC092111 TaxID=3364289 RepID=UPI003801EFC0